MLLQEEQYIIHWLTEYGALTKTQVVRMLKDKPPQTAEKIIRGLKRDVLLYDISGGYYLGVDPMCQPDPRMILAVWVLLQFIDKVEPMAHYPATYPSQIFFLKEDIGYEIVVLYDGEQHLARLLQPQEDLRYIFVLPHIRMAQELVLPSVPCLFCHGGLQRSGGARCALLHRERGRPGWRSLTLGGLWPGPSAGWSVPL